MINRWVDEDIDTLLDCLIGVMYISTAQKISALK